MKMYFEYLRKRAEALWWKLRGKYSKSSDLTKALDFYSEVDNGVFSRDVFSQTRWHAPAFSAAWEAEAGRPLEPKSFKPVLGIRKSPSQKR